MHNDRQVSAPGPTELDRLAGTEPLTSPTSRWWPRVVSRWRSTSPRQRGRRNPFSTMWLFLARLGVLVALVGIWQLVVILKLADPTVTSRPSAVFSYLGHAVSGSEMWTNLSATMEATLIAFGLASVVGIVIGVALGLLPRVEKVIDPYLTAINAMPRIAFAPVFVVAFGLSITSKIALAFSIVVFILITSARAGVQSLDVDITRLATLLGASKRQMFSKVLLPVAVPSIFGGLRLGLIYSLLGVTTSELIASTNGIGQMLQQAAGLFRIDEVYGLLIILAIVASVINLLMGTLERYLLRWQPKADR